MFTDRMVKPSELDGVNLDLSEDSELTSPFVDILSSINSDPKNLRSKQELANKFKEFRNIDLFETTSRIESQTDTVQTDGKSPKTVDLDVSIAIGDDYGGLFPEQDKITKKYIYSILFNPHEMPSDYDGPNYQTNFIIYREAVVQKARDFLRSTYYHGKWIIKDGTINPEIYRILQEKFGKGESFTKLEEIIADVASFYQNEIDYDDDEIIMCDGGFDRHLIKEYEETTGREAFVNNEATESFKSWYDTIQATTNNKDTRSSQAKQILSNKKDTLKEILIEQLQHYSQTGERLYSKKEALAKTTLSRSTLKKYAKVILEQIFTDPESASLIYDLLFGVILTSYQKSKGECIEKGLILKTTPTQWFDMLKNRGETWPSRILVEVQCTEPEGHVSLVQMGQILGCDPCRIATNLNKPLGLQDVLKLAGERKIQAISFSDDSQELTEDEFNELVKEFNAQHQSSNDYKTGAPSYMNLKWKCLDCNRVFERVYNIIQRQKTGHYCPSCISSIDAQITLEKTEEAFQGRITQSFRSNEQLYKFIPERTLLMPEHQIISDPRVHVDVYGVVSVAGKEFKLAVEHQGRQHYSLEAYTTLRRNQDLSQGIYKTNEQYEIDFNDQVKKDAAKVELFKGLNKDGYILIVVPYNIHPAKRTSYILKEFLRQTNINPGQANILDFI